MLQRLKIQTDGGPSNTGKASSNTMAGRQVLDLISQLVPFSQALIVSTLPRGSVHIVQPARTAESLLKSYTREFHREDRLAWQAIFRNQTVRSSDVWTQSEFQNSPYLHGFLQPHGLRFAMAVPLANPVLNGYPGAAVLMRGPDEGDFSDAEVGKLKNIGREMDEFTSKSRPNRNAEVQMNTDPWTHQAPTRMFIFNKDAKAIFPKGKLNIDERVEQQLLAHVKQAAENAKRGQLYSDRLLLPDSRGDIWVFHGIVHRDFPALGPGPAIFFMLQPESNEWVSVRPNEVAADNEMVRLLPTLKFMQQEFHKNPTLDDIARKAHLSPFHFHRRFTDLIGQTPKHFLLGCQIHAAKRGLASRRRELAQIASDTGFAHQSHFTSRFKQATGLTPTRWRHLAAEIVRAQK
jgi:AraC-like DNA-binding protein